MSDVGLILITFAVDPQKLFDSATRSRHRLTWFVYHHGPEGPVEMEMYRRSESCENIRFTSYRENRGVAKSWNEGIKCSFSKNMNHHVLLNDDLFFIGERGIDDFVDWLDEKAG